MAVDALPARVPNLLPEGAPAIPVDRQALVAFNAAIFGAGEDKGARRGVVQTDVVEEARAGVARGCKRPGNARVACLARGQRGADMLRVFILVGRDKVVSQGEGAALCAGNSELARNAGMGNGLVVKVEPSARPRPPP